MQINLKDFAMERGVQPGSIVKALRRAGVTNIGVNSDLTPDMLAKIQKSSTRAKNIPAVKEAVPAIKQEVKPVEPIIEKVVIRPSSTPKSYIERKAEKTNKAKPVKKQNTDATQVDIFKNIYAKLVVIGILVFSDALCFAWIAWNTFPDFQIIAAGVFAFVGIAVGYAAIKTIVSYNGWSGDSWTAGFGIFQIALHTCAMEVWGLYSYPAGKIVIALGVALGTAGMAVALKYDNRK